MCVSPGQTLKSTECRGAFADYVGTMPRNISYYVVMSEDPLPTVLHFYPSGLWTENYTQS